MRIKIAKEDKEFYDDIPDRLYRMYDKLYWELKKSVPYNRKPMYDKMFGCLGWKFNYKMNYEN